MSQPSPLRLSRNLPFILLLLGFLAAPAFPKDVPFRVLPWNGYKAALSLTYDDGDPIHLDVAIPEMQKRDLRGTFFLIGKPLTRDDEWKKAAESGQEIGNHTWTHRHTSELTGADEKSEVVQTRAKLEKLAGKPVLTLAYPFVEISPGLRKWVEANDFEARGGGQSQNYLTPGMDPDWMNLPSQATMTAFPYETYQSWVDQDLSQGAWTLLMIHAIEGSTWYQPIPKDIYLKFLDYLVEKKSELWIAPFGEVGAYWRAEKWLEKVEPKKAGKKTVLHWKKPSVFPSGVVLKAHIEGGGLVVTQGGKAVLPLSPDVYPVAVDAQELTLENAAWIPEEVAPAAAAPTPLPSQETWRIRAGGADAKDSAGNPWAKDQGFQDGDIAVTDRPITAKRDADLYRTERWGKDFSYALPVPQGEYQVRLLFAETYVKKPGERVFDILINGERVLGNFDLLKSAGAMDKGLEKTFKGIRPDADGKIKIRFTASVQNAKVCAIEVLKIH